MKRHVGLLALLLWAAGPSCPALAELLDGSKPNVIERVVTLMQELQEKIRNDGELEQASYDKFACWCEDTLQRKATDIAEAKDAIESLSKEIFKLTGEIATHRAEIAQLKKDIAANVEAQREATEVRDKERGEYTDDKNENEQCMGALEAAIKVLQGAGTGKKAGLITTRVTMQEAQLFSVVAGVRGLLQNPALARTVKRDDLQVVQQFVDKPEDFVGRHSSDGPMPSETSEVLPNQGVFYPNELGGFLSNLQISKNPYGAYPAGDYAPQSARVSGALKAMYDAFASDLEKANAEEADKQKAFEELMKTKQTELATLEATLDQQTLYEAEKSKDLAENKADLQNTREQLAADMAFFAQAKESCKIKAGHWAQRVRMRTEELKGIDNAVELLDGEETREIFKNATSTMFLQVGSKTGIEDGQSRNSAYKKLQALASKFQSVKIARMAMAVSTAGRFDDVILAIDKMIELLRREEQDDIKERDYCENKLRKNKIDTEDLGFDIDKLDDELKRADDDKKELNDRITELEEKMNATEDEMDELRAQRVEQQEKFRQSVKDDTDAIMLLEQAIEALSAYYKKNKMPIGLAQASHRTALAMLASRRKLGEVQRHLVGAPAPAPAAKYNADPDIPPETIFEDGDYKGHASEATGLVAILKMIQEDFQKEIDTARKEDAAAQQVYDEDMAGLNAIMEKTTQKRNGLDRELADLMLKKSRMEAAKHHKNAGLGVEADKKEALDDQCDWVETHFQSRRDKRKAEIQGLQEAKSYLAGMDHDMALLQASDQ